MPELAIPDFITDPPLVAFGCDALAARWLAALGLAHAGTGASIGDPPELIRRLAEALDVTEQRIKAILGESRFRYQLKAGLVEFHSVPHEAEARRHFIRLATRTYRYRRCCHGRPQDHAILPYYAEGAISRLNLDVPCCDRLVQEWVDWAATWAALVARNPALELRQRMGDVFDTNDSTSWWIGGERLLDDWLARGSRDPMPIFDTRKIVTEAYYRRLCELRKQSGGWFYYREDLGQVVYVPRAEWERISASWPKILEQVCANHARFDGP